MTDTRIIEDIVDILANKLTYDTAFETRSILVNKLIEELGSDDHGVVHANISWLIELLIRIAKNNEKNSFGLY
jgi:hypothetical protein